MIAIACQSYPAAVAGYGRHECRGRAFLTRQRATKLPGSSCRQPRQRAPRNFALYVREGASRRGRDRDGIDLSTSQTHRDSDRRRDHSRAGWIA